MVFTPFHSFIVPSMHLYTRAYMQTYKHSSSRAKEQMSDKENISTHGVLERRLLLDSLLLGLMEKKKSLRSTDHSRAAGAIRIAQDVVERLRKAHTSASTKGRVPADEAQVLLRLIMKLVRKSAWALRLIDLHAV